MKCKLDRDTLIAPLQLVTNVIERRQTLPILANVCLDLKQEAVTLIGKSRKKWPLLKLKPPGPVQ